MQEVNNYRRHMSFSAKKALILTAICVITFLCFRNTLNNQFTNWDDDYYVTNDPYIKAFTPENLKVLFTQDITKNNYHPLCMLSLAVNYHFAELSPMTYYLTNILIHIANIILVFFLFIELCRRLMMGNDAGLFIASLGALWFGIHPMHVESVAWIAERKDVLYTFFYIIGLLCYLKYTETEKKKWYWLSFAVFVASGLSKPMAVVFPMSLLCMDILLQRPGGKKLVTEKMIFFLFSLICGGMAFYTQSRTGAVASFGTLTIAERVMYASYGFIMYISKLFNPSYLSTFYPYPFRYIDGSLHSIFYLAPFLAIGIIALPTWYLYKKKSPYFRIYAFGMGFFVFNVALVLQFISVGAAIMSDRYSYVAYIGLLFMLAYFIHELMVKKPGLKAALWAVLIIFSGWLTYLCYERTFVWHDSETLLTDAIEKYPFHKDPDKPHDGKNSGIAMLSYKWLGNYFFSIGQLEKAQENYEILTTIHAADEKVKQNLAKVQALLSGVPVMPGAYSSNAPHADINDNTFKLYMDSTIALSKAGDSLGAFRRYIAAFRLNQQAEKVLAEHSYNLVQSQQYPEAQREYDILLKLNGGNPFYHFLRGVSFYGQNQIKTAISDWEMALKMNSKDVQQSAAYNLSVAYDTLGNDSMAIYYLSRAQGLGYAPTPEYVSKINKRYQEQKKRKK